MRLSLEPGLYNRDQVLQVSGRDPALALRYAFFNRGAWGTWLPCREPLALSALPGEEREYRLKVAAFPAGPQGLDPLEERELAVRIDRRAPAPPVVLPQLPLGGAADAGGPAGAENPERVRLAFHSPDEESVWYAVDSVEPEAGRPWDGRPVELGLPAVSAGEHFLRAWCRDPAGNRSAERFYRFTLTAAPPHLSIASPAPGRFANRQLLVLNTRHLAEVRYTLDGSDPLEHGRVYTGPVLLQETGTLRLRAVGRPVAGGPPGGAAPPLQQETIVQVIPEETPSLGCDAESGLRASGLQAGASGAAGSRLFFTLSERTPTEADPPVKGPIALESLPLSRREYVLRLRALDGAGRWGGEYRYFFVIDRSRPPEPRIAWERTPDGALAVTLRGGEGARLHYTLDGSPPGDSSPVYHAPLRVELSARPELTIRAVAIGPSGQPGEAAESRLAFDLLPPEPALLRLLSAAGGGKPALNLGAGSGSLPPVTNRPVLLSPQAPREGKVIYEISSDGTDPAPLSPGSPAFDGDQLLTVPYGLHREFRLRIGARDEAGNVTELPGARAVVLDREPPAPPILTPRPGGEGFDRPLRVGLEFHDRVRVELTADGSLPPDPSPRSPLLERALELNGRPGERTEYRLKLLLTDEAGNQGEVCGPFSYPVDLRRPILPPLAGPENGGCTNEREVSLVPGTSPFRVAFTATEDGSEPPDPGPTSPLLGAEVRFAGDSDQEKTIRLKLLPVSPGRSLQGIVSAYRFTIDLKPPSTPRIAGFEPGSRHNRPVRMEAGTDDPRDRIYVSSSSAAWSLPDPLSQGTLYREPLLFEPPEGGEQAVFLRVAAVDPAGNRAVVDRYAGFVLDRRPPEPPELRVVPDQPLSRDRFSVILQAAEGRIRYELSDDGGTPPVPTAGSPLYQSPLLLGGKEGEEVTWRVIAVAVDGLGNASAPTPIAVLRVDRSLPPLPPEPGVRALEEEGRWLLSWQVPAGHRLFYRGGAASVPGTPFLLYEAAGAAAGDGCGGDHAPAGCAPRGPVPGVLPRRRGRQPGPDPDLPPAAAAPAAARAHARRGP